MTFGEKLRELRVVLGHSRKDLGDILSVGHQQVRRYETDEVLPDHEKVKQLCEIYNYDFVSLIYGFKPSTEPTTDDYKSKYIKLLEKENLQKDNIINVNLTAIQVSQQSILANLEAGIEMSLDLKSEGNPKKAASLKREWDRRIGEKMGVSVRKGSSADM